MINICDAQSSEELDILDKCLQKCQSGSCLVTLKQFFELPDGKITSQKLRQEQFDGNFKIEIENRADIGLVHVYMILKRKSDIQYINNLLDIVRKRGTQKFLKGQFEENDYALVVDIMNVDPEIGKAYILSFIQPMFVSNEGEGSEPHTFEYKVTFNKIDVNFEINDFSMSEVEYEIMSDPNNEEYLSSIEEDDSSISSSNDFNDNDDILNNNNIIGT